MKNPSKPRGGLHLLVAFLLPAAVCAAFSRYYDTYANWQPKLYAAAVAVLVLGVVAMTLVTLQARGERKPLAVVWKTALSLAVFCGVLFGVAFPINNVMYGGAYPGAAIASVVTLPLCAAQILVLFILFMRTPRMRSLRESAGRAVTTLLSVGLAAAVVFSGLACVAPWYVKNHYRAPAPPELLAYSGEFEPMPELGEYDFTVASGALGMEDVRDEIRKLRSDPANADRHYTVLIEDGEYGIKHIEFDERDFNMTYRSRDGGVILTGGLQLLPKDFTAVNAGAAARLPKSAREKVVQIDLTALGLGAEDWGKLYAFGAYTTAAKYDGAVGPLPCELFVDGKRQTLARYPNGDAWLKTGRVLDNGDCQETYENGTTLSPGWPDLRDPRGGTFEMDKKTAARVKNWRDDPDIWVFGCFMWDWADMSTPVKSFDKAAGTLTTAHASSYGFGRHKNYYFYNVFEELDAPGEWYLDRDAGVLYLYPPEGDFENSRVDISLGTDMLIVGSGLENVSFVGLTLQGTRGDAMVLSGNNITVDHCVVRNIAGSAITLNGYNNAVSNNEVYRVGKQGISIGGGDQTTLTPGNNKAVNNLVHDWPEVVMTYQGGINVSGTGNLVAHNEIYNSPHTAIFFNGNNNIVEYNLIHDVCLLTLDAGAIYGHNGGYVNTYGTVFRNNAIYNLGHLGGDGRGDRANSPNAIYLDGGCSGITMENNLIFNVPNNGLALNGGRELTARGNVLVNCGIGIEYSASQVKAVNAQAFEEGPGVNGRDPGPLAASAYQTPIWQAAFPNLAKLHLDYDNMEDINFGANPAYSVVTDNVLVGGKEALKIHEYVPRYSTVEPNDVYGLRRTRDYWKLPEFEKISVEQIGRVGDVSD